ncbi:hypothetical protein GQ457_08G025970 [Hibiscus cannabinus]
MEEKWVHLGFILCMVNFLVVKFSAGKQMEGKSRKIFTRQSYAEFLLGAAYADADAGILEWGRRLYSLKLMLLCESGVFALLVDEGNISTVGNTFSSFPKSVSDCQVQVVEMNHESNI